MPNRIIKESIRTSKSVNSMTDFQFRLWAYLITYVDDFGRGSADPEILKGFVFPRRKGLTESTIAKTLAELAAIGSIVLYEVDGESYLYFPNWGEHQRIQTKKSKFPPPEDVPQKNTVDHGNSRCVTVDHGNSPLESKSKIESKYELESKIEEYNTRLSARFSPPTVEDVKAYCIERKNHVDPQQFCDFYESKGWRIGQNKMKDWKSAVRTWERRESYRTTSQNKRAQDLDNFYDMAKDWADN